MKAGATRDSVLRMKPTISAFPCPVSLDGVDITPWAAFAAIGNASGYWDYMYDETNNSSGRRAYGYDARGLYSWEEGATSSAWFVGSALKVSVWDPWTVKADFMYGKLDGNKGAPTTGGWFADAALSYKLDWGVPTLFGWYSTGDKAGKDKNDAHGGRMPTLGLDNGFNISNFGFADGYALGGDQAAFTTGVGLWGIGVELTKIRIWEKLSHEVRFIYARGTNNSESARYRMRESGNDFNGVDFHGFYLTHHDKYYEINFNHFYDIYENLEMSLELGLIHLDLDEKVWGNSITTNRGSYKLSDTTTGYQAMVSWKFKF